MLTKEENTCLNHPMHAIFLKDLNKKGKAEVL